MSGLIFIIAQAGLKLPLERNPRQYVTDAAPSTVEASHYYRKAINDGDVKELTEQERDEFFAKRAEHEQAEAAEAEEQRKKNEAAEAKTAKATAKKS